MSVMRGVWVSLGSILSLVLTSWAETVPDFSLEDINASSSRYGDLVSPRDYRFQISAYYFGLAG
jgi:hypothetical protein